MPKSIHNILLVTLRDVITYSAHLPSSLENPSQPSVRYVFALGSASGLPGEQPAGPARRRLTDASSYLPQHPRSAPPCPPDLSHPNRRVLFQHGRNQPDRFAVVCYLSLTRLYTLSVSLPRYTSVYLQYLVCFRKSVFLVTT